MGIERPVYVSHGSGIYRLDYKDEKGNDAIRTYEESNGHVVYVQYEKDGSVVDQGFTERPLDDSVKEFLLSLQDYKEIAADYKEVTLQRKCPKCNSGSLTRIREGSFSIVPMYICNACKTKSYHLSNAYLKKLVYEHMSLFESNEKEELVQDEEKFMAELKDYILKIYAAKKIMKIEGD